MKTEPNINPVFQSIKDAADSVGLSKYFLRKLLKAGELPHVKSGNKIMVDTERLIEQLRDGGNG